MLDFILDYKTDKKKALILGKGPSLDRLPDYDTSDFLTIGINHVGANHRVDIAHVIDFSVIDECGDKLYQNAKVLVMPYHPHFGFRPSSHLKLEEISKSHTLLSKFREEGRLYAYNLSTIRYIYGDSPVIKAKYFTSEASVNLCDKLGLKEIRTLGIDGGRERSKEFDHLDNVNAERGYDAQWQGIRKTIQESKINFGPLGVESPIRIFIGAGNQQIVPALVLKHSILKHATMSVDVTIMNEWTHPMPKDRMNQPRTPFSFQRFMIPEKNSGRLGIYMDSDMLVFGDVKEIWTEPTREGLLTMRNDDVDKHRAKFAVCRYDSVLAHPTIKDIVDGLDSGKWTYEDVVFDFKHEFFGIRDGFNPDWNSLEEYTEGKTKLLHYTEFYRQPWHVNSNHELGYLWFKELQEAVSDGSISRELVCDHVKRGWLLPKCEEVLGALV